MQALVISGRMTMRTCEGDIVDSQGEPPEGKGLVRSEDQGNMAAKTTAPGLSPALTH